MKRLLILVLSLAMIMGLSVYAFADDDICELTDEEQALVLSVKSIFLGEKVADGTITQKEADEMYEQLVNQVHNNALRGLGFGQWLRESEYSDDLYEIMPHKGQGSNAGSYSGDRPFNGRGHRGGRHN